MFPSGSSDPLPLAGVFTAEVAHGSHVLKTRIYVTKGGHGMLLSCRTAESLQLVAFCFECASMEYGGVVGPIFTFV